MRARVVALSLVYPEYDPRLPDELKLLRESLPAGTVLLGGGRARPAYRDSPGRLRALIVANLEDLGEALDRLREDSRRRRA
jgi:hypothetical protein